MLEDLLNEELTDQDPHIVVQRVTDLWINRTIADQNASQFPRSKTLGKAKSLLDFYDLVRQAIDDYETRKSASTQSKIFFTEEEPDAESTKETIAFSLVKRQPGGFGQGAPFECGIKNLKPILREIGADLDNPTYRTFVMGYWHDNIVRFTSWARTNKAANTRASWFEGLMEEYNWWFVLQGMKRVIYWGQGSDLVLDIKNNRWYGRPIDYYVQTETLRTYSEKELEHILISQDIGE